MRNKGLYLFFVLFGIMTSVVFISCASHPGRKVYPSGVFLKIQDQSFFLKKTGQALIQSLDVEGPLLFWSSEFPILNSAQVPAMIERRKKQFLALFKDEVDPYTAQRTLRSKCLVAKESARVEFISGKSVDWAHCFDSGAAPAARVWLACGATLWEITLQGLPEARKKLTLQCRENGVTAVEAVSL